LDKAIGYERISNLRKQPGSQLIPQSSSSALSFRAGYIMRCPGPIEPGKIFIEQKPPWPAIDDAAGQEKRLYGRTLQPWHDDHRRIWKLGNGQEELARRKRF